MYSTDLERFGWVPPHSATEIASGWFTKLSSPRATFACGTHASLQYRRRLVRDRPSRRRLAASFAVDVVAPRRPCSTFTPADATQLRHARRSLSAFIATPAATPSLSPRRSSAFRRRRRRRPPPLPASPVAHALFALPHVPRSLCIDAPAARQTILAYIRSRLALGIQHRQPLECGMSKPILH